MDYKLEAVDIQDQIELMNQILNDSFAISFVDSDQYPSADELRSIFVNLDQAISYSDGNPILVELQLLLFLTMINGLGFDQAISLNNKNWNNLEDLQYQDRELKIIVRNNYCCQLISMIPAKPKDPIFTHLNANNALDCINLYLVMNGIEHVLTKDKLQMIFGRFLYLRHGRFRPVREFLKEYYSCESHIDLLVELKLVDSIYYNSMMRN